MSHNRTTNPRERLRIARKNADEALCLSNQTGKASDRQKFMEALQEAEEAQQELETAQFEPMPEYDKSEEMEVYG